MIPSYAEFLGKIKREGATRASRYGSTIELLDTQVMSPPGEMLDRDNTNYNIGYVEAVALLAGIYDKRAIRTLAPNAQHVLFTHEMAYGPRTTLQLEAIINKLSDDPDTRQAVLFVGKPEDGPTNHQPCTTTLHFIVRDGELRCSARMRSNDVVKGTPPDLMMFHALTGMLAYCLDYEQGPVTLSCTSSHIYLRDIERLARTTTHRFGICPQLPPNFAAIRQLALEALQDPESWPQSTWRKHRVPPLFYETEISEQDPYRECYSTLDLEPGPLVRPRLVPVTPE